MTSEAAYTYAQTSLCSTLYQRFQDWLQQRKPQENRMFDCYQDWMRINRDDEGKDSGLARSQQAKLFIGSSRGKVRSAKAKIRDVMFGGGEMPFDTEPTSEDLKEFSDTMEKILNLQLRDMNFERMIGAQGVSSLGVYGTGFCFGPFVKDKDHTYTQVAIDPMTGAPALSEQKHTYPCPYFEHGRTMDCYPDPEAEDVDQGRGLFWAAKKQKEFILSLKGQPGFWDEAVEHAYNQRITAYTSDGSDRTDMARRNLYRYEKDGRIWYHRYFGTVLVTDFLEWKVAAGQMSEEEKQKHLEGVDEREVIEVMAILGGGVVLKVDQSPWARRPAYRAVYEEAEHEMWGVGIAENNEGHQKVLNASARAFIENKAFSLNPPRSIDRSKYKATEDFKLYPGKIFEMQDGLTPEERQNALMVHAVPDVSEGWQTLIALSERLSDDDTAITKYSQGDDSPALNKTATGISMIMNASSLPIKEVISNIDRMWIEPMIQALIEWDMKYLDPETVKILLGEKEAVVWKTIQQFGKTSFMKWFATGAKSFMMREVLMHKLQGFLQLVLSGGPATLPHVDVRELLDQIWRAGQVGLESPIMSDDNKTAQAVNAVKQQAAQIIQQLQAELAQAKDRKVIDFAKVRNDAQRVGLEVEKTIKENDLLEAQTVATLLNAGVRPDGTLMREAQTSDDTGTASGDSGTAQPTGTDYPGAGAGMAGAGVGT